MTDTRSGYGPLIEEPKTDSGPRCTDCGRKLAELVTRPWVIRCTRCKATNIGFMRHQEAATRALAAEVEDAQSHREARKPVAGRTQPHRGR